MKLITVSCVVIALLFLSIHASSPTSEILYNSSFPNTGTVYYANGLEYFSESIYDPSTGQFYSVLIPDFCGMSPSFSPQVIPWCYGVVSNKDSTRTYIVYYLNAYLNQSIGTQVVGTYPLSTSFNYQYTNNFLVLTFTGFQSNPDNYSVIIYDLENKQPACPKATIDPINTDYTIYTDGKIFLFGYLDENHNANFTLLNCSTGQTYSSPGNTEYLMIDLYGFNHSTVFINYYDCQINSIYAASMIQPASFDSENKLQFGSSINVTTFLPYNGTHFFMVYSPGGNVIFGLFVITPELQILEVLSFNLGIPGDDFGASPAYGMPWINFNLGGVFVTYDVNARGIIAVDSIVPPITLNNGSVVNMTQYGYFIQSPGGPFYFINTPFSNPTNGIYQDPTDFNQYYTLFVPGPSDPSYNKCVLTHVNATSSQITKNFFPNCPITLPISNIVNIKDVQYDANGSPTVVYRDSYGSVVAINSAGSNGPFKSTYLYTSIQLSLNLTNGTINFVGSQLTNFVVGRISLTSGTVLANRTFHTGTYYTSIFKITAQYYSILFSDPQTKFEIIDAVNLVEVSSVVSNLKLNLYSTPGYVVGFNPSTPANFTGVVFWTSGFIYLMNSVGQVTALNPGISNSVYDVVPISQNQFFASQFEIFLGREVFYEITSWGLRTANSRSGDEEIEV